MPLSATADLSSLPPPPPRSRPWAPGLALLPLAVLAVAWVDFSTGHDIGLALFYLGPIAGAAWHLGRSGGIGLAVLSSAAWLAADLASRTSPDLVTSVINSCTRLGTFVVVAVLIARVRADRDRLEHLLSRERRLARTDGLTGLMNSRAFLGAVKTELARARRATATVCLAYLDLDNFKRVNDRYGHTAGDELLVAVARALDEECRETDIKARLGGDEFAILFWNLGVADVETLARRLLGRTEALSRDYPGTDLGVSIGVAAFDTAPLDVEEVIRRADAAMYSVKARSKGGVTIVRC